MHAAPQRPQRPAGFTLVELLVAIGILALLAALSWRSLDAMGRSLSLTGQRTDAVLSLQLGLEQWGADLDAAVATAAVSGLDWNGNTLRLTRQSGQAGDAGVRVVAWTRRVVDGRGFWLRWQSPLLTRNADIALAWQQAAQWGQTPDSTLNQNETTLSELDGWQLLYAGATGWTAAATSASSTAPTGVATAAGATGTASAGAPQSPWAYVITGSTNLSSSGATVAPAASGITPAGIRLVLQLPAGTPCPGTITRDWVNPTAWGNRS